MLDKQVPKKLTKKHIQELCKMFKKNRVLFAYQFGSTVKDKMLVGPLSDYDFAIYFDESQPDTTNFGRQIDMATKISRILKFSNIDVIDLNNCDSIIRHKAIFSGKNIYSNDDAKRFAFEHKAVQIYEDIKPLNKTANQILRNFVLNGTIGKPMFYHKANI